MKTHAASRGLSRGWRIWLGVALVAGAIVVIGIAACRQLTEGGNTAEASPRPRPATVSDQSGTSSEVDSASIGNASTQAQPPEAVVPFFFEPDTPSTLPCSKTLAEAVRVLKAQGYENVNDSGHCDTERLHGGRWVVTSCHFVKGPKATVLMDGGRKRGAKVEPTINSAGINLLGKPGTWSTLSQKLEALYGSPENHGNVLVWKRSGCELGASLSKANESHEWININWGDWCADPFDQQDERIRSRCGR